MLKHKIKRINFWRIMLSLSIFIATAIVPRYAMAIVPYPECQVDASDNELQVQTNLSDSIKPGTSIDTSENLVNRALINGVKLRIYDSPWSVRTNVPALGLFNFNAGAEYRLSSHWTA